MIKVKNDLYGLKNYMENHLPELNIKYFDTNPFYVVSGHTYFINIILQHKCTIISLIAEHLYVSNNYGK